MILAATGHRPDKLGGYSSDVENRLRLLAHRYLAKTKPSFVISGMALGWDQAVAGASLLAGIPYVAAIPFEGQERKWPARSQEVYRELLIQAARIHVVTSSGWSRDAFQRRNEWMVDHCDHLVALWNGSSGGTGNCLVYAKYRNKPWDNLWDEWQYFS